MTTQGLPKPTFKGLQAGGFTTPLRRIRGKLLAYHPYIETFGGSGRSATMISFQFADFEVLESDVPMVNVIPEIKVKYSEKESSAWGKLGDSYAEALGCDRDSVDIDSTIGLVQEWLRSEENWGKNKQTGEDMIGSVWKVVNIGSNNDGAILPVKGKVLPTGEVALAMLDGKIERDFWAEALSDPNIKKDAAFCATILDSSFVAGHIATGKVTLDGDGVYHVA